MNEAQREIVEEMELRWTRERYGTSRLYEPRDEREREFSADCERLVAAGTGGRALVEAHAEIDRLNRRIEELEAGPEIGDGSIFIGGAKTSLSVDGMYAAIVLPEEVLQPVIGADHPHPDVA